VCLAAPVETLGCCDGLVQDSRHPRERPSLGKWGISPTPTVFPALAGGTGAAQPPALNPAGGAGVEDERGSPKMDTRRPDFVTPDVPDAA
jgi:hypothetical protein